MPLQSIKNGARKCSALTKRTKEPCKNLAAYGCKVCRYHGAHKIKVGNQAPNYKHGHRSKEWMKKNSEQLCQLRYLEDLGHAIGMMSGTKTRGRKPKDYIGFNSLNEVKKALEEN